LHEGSPSLFISISSSIAVGAQRKQQGASALLFLSLLVLSLFLFSRGVSSASIAAQGGLDLRVFSGAAFEGKAHQGWRRWGYDV